MTIERIGPMDPIPSFKKAKGPEKPKKGEGADSITLSEEAKSKAEAAVRSGKASLENAEATVQASRAALENARVHLNGDVV